MIKAFFIIFLVPIVATVGCSSPNEVNPFINAEPGVGSIEISLPRTLRLYFQQLPDVSRSSVTLSGPNGELVLRGLHSMGANDLMMEIYDDVIGGQYKVEWQTYVGDDPTLYKGSYFFTVQPQ